MEDASGWIHRIEQARARSISEGYKLSPACLTSRASDGSANTFPAVRIACSIEEADDLVQLLERLIYARS